MLIVVGLLLYFMTITGVRLPEWFPLASYIPEVLLAGFVLIVVLYLWDERRRLRDEVREAWAAEQDAVAELDATVSWLEFSHHAASALGVQGVGSGNAGRPQGSCDAVLGRRRGCLRRRRRARIHRARCTCQ